MASGFITLGDGRGFAIRWTGYDMLLQLVVRQLGERADEQSFRQFLLDRLPSNETEEMGWGFFRPADGKTVQRILDLRELHEQDHQLFWAALQRAYRNIRLGAPHEGTAVFVESVRQLLRRRRAAARRASPFVDNDWREGYLEPSTGHRIGPGWDAPAAT